MVDFRGRSGWGKQKGIEVTNVSDEYIMLCPVTSRGGASDSASLRIPMENVEEFAKTLLKAIGKG